MFKWPGVPTSRAQAHELADFAEILCWQRGTASVTDISQDLGRLDDNDYSDGVPEEEEIPRYIEDAFQEIELRIEACGGGYPFRLDEKGNVLYATQGLNKASFRIYKYLLLATRLNMGTGRDSNRSHADIDGTMLLEELSAETSRKYFGARSESMVFGTAAGNTNFPSKVTDLCNRIKEGGSYANHAQTSRQNARDGKLDVVVWKHFSDGLAGKVIAFGQCKTGTNYKDTLTQLQPDIFCRKWIQSQPALTPMRMFFVAEALHRGDWYNLASDTGLLFDRCRIVDFSNQLNRRLLDRIEAWTSAAAEATGLPSP